MHPVRIGRSLTNEKAARDGNAPLPLLSRRHDPAQHANNPPDPPFAIGSLEQAWKRLISRTVPQDELPFLIKTIFSDRETIKMVDQLRGSDAQAFVDIIDGVRQCPLFPRSRLVYSFNPLCPAG